jgi:hypothetical protein
MSIVESPGSLPERPAPVRRRSLRVVLSRAEVDLPAAERAVVDLLVALGKDPTAEHLWASASPAHAQPGLGAPRPPQHGPPATRPGPR